MINPELDQAILAILEQGSLSEFELIKTLQQPPYQLLQTNVFTDELSLFQTHFVLHNALYRLRDIGLAQKSFDIDTLTTQLKLIKLSQANKEDTHPKNKQDTHVKKFDTAIVDMVSSPKNNRDTHLSTEIRPEIVKLREYYLDWRNFEKTGQQDVVDLLSSFWQRFSTFDSSKQQLQLNEALKQLDFDEVPSLTALKSRYKKLSNQYHPDKGGSAEAFGQLQQHYQVIKLFTHQG